MNAELASARRRHPSARWPHTADHLRVRVATMLDTAGAAHPDVAAAVLAARGATGLDRVGFARRLEVEVEVVARAERGATGWHELPPSLRRLC